MTVAELIEMLKALPPDAKVFVRHDMAGLSPADVPRSVRVQPEPDWHDSTYWKGSHYEIAGDGGTLAVLIEPD